MLLPPTLVCWLVLFGAVPFCTQLVVSQFMCGVVAFSLDRSSVLYVVCLTLFINASALAVFMGSELQYGDWLESYLCDLSTTSLAARKGGATIGDVGGK